LVADFTAVRQKLLDLGAKNSKPRVYEKNIRLDTPDEALLQKWQLLRIRQDTAVKITFKGDPPNPIQSEAKVREELEIEASDLDTAVLIFQRLGFAPVQIYEKYRETWAWQDVEIVLDEMPYGNFIELEGNEAALKEAAAGLNLNWDQRVLANYLGLMAQLQAHHNLPFNDLTFANFKGKLYSAADILPSN
jgi:adenylate cyclase class 2